MGTPQWRWRLMHHMSRVRCIAVSRARPAAGTKWTSTSAASAFSCTPSRLANLSSQPNRSHVGAEGDPGGGGLQGARPRAGQLEGPASRGLRGVFGLVPLTFCYPPLSIRTKPPFAVLM
eukprot:7571408-Pyramimonas_sp.AAC.2